MKDKKFRIFRIYKLLSFIYYKHLKKEWGGACGLILGGGVEGAQYPSVSSTISYPPEKN